MKKLAFIIVLLAVALQAAIPIGFMPGQANAGTSMVICSGMDQITIHLDGDGNPIDGPAHTGEQKEFCAYSMIPVARDIDAPPQIIKPQFHTQAQSLLTADNLVKGRYFNTPPATAPPV